MVTIKVTQEHIDSGLRFTFWHCPIALAVSKKYPKSFHDVGVNTVAIGQKIVKLPKAAVKFIANFDKKRPVKPFSFKLNY